MRLIGSLLFVSVLTCTLAVDLTKTVYTSKPAQDGGNVVQMIDDKLVINKQKVIFDLLKFIHIRDYNIDKHYVELKDFKFTELIEYYKNVDFIRDFIRLVDSDMLVNHDKVFSVLNEYHRKQAILLFKLFFYARDWNVFQKLMIWSRYNVNPHMFVYALQTAVYHRTDMIGIVFPRIYEIFPNYFYGSHNMERVQQMKMKMKSSDFTEPIVIDTNLTMYNDYTYLDPELKLKYYTEDVGLNAYYHNFHIDYPTWMGGDEFNLLKDHRGEWFMYFHQQLLARYQMERLSNDMGPVNVLSYYAPVKTGYYSNLRYYNGYPFAPRDNNYYVYNAQNYYRIQMLEDYERRLRDGIDNGFFMLNDSTSIDLTRPESIEFLGNYLHGNSDCRFKRFYNYMEIFAQTMNGYGVAKANSINYAPSVLAHYETQLRDPVFYQLIKRFMFNYYKFKKYLPTYKYEDYNFDGLRIDSVDIDKLYTFFDKYESDVTNIVDIPTDTVSTIHNKGINDKLYIKYRHYRLNHEGFQIRLNVHVDKPIKGVVRIFMGPKYDFRNDFNGFDENHENFFELDNFVVDFKDGKNIITRHSDEFYWFGKDITTFYELYKMIMLNSKSLQYTTDLTSRCKFPYRLLLPMGKVTGLPVQFYFIVTKYVPPKVEQFTGYDKGVTCGVGSGSRYIDGLPLGFPFNRRIDLTTWNTPNMYYYDTFVFHKSLDTPRDFNNRMRKYDFDDMYKKTTVNKY